MQNQYVYDPKLQQSMNYQQQPINYQQQQQPINYQQQQQPINYQQQQPINFQQQQQQQPISYQQSNPYQTYQHQPKLLVSPTDSNTKVSNFEDHLSDTGNMPPNKKIFSLSLKNPLTKPVVDKPDESNNDMKSNVQKQFKPYLDTLRNDLMSSFTNMLSDFKNEGKLNTNK